MGGNNGFVTVRITRLHSLELVSWSYLVSPQEVQIIFMTAPSLDWFISVLRFLWCMGGFCFTFVVLQEQEAPRPALLQEGRNRCGSSRFYFHISKNRSPLLGLIWALSCDRLLITHTCVRKCSHRQPLWGVAAALGCFVFVRERVCL